jgi:4-hydroxymandelate oxidase
MKLNDEVRTEARRLMEGFCRVCKKCDGRSCAGEVPGMGGAGSGSSFFANMEALERCRLNMSTIHDSTDPDTSTIILDHKLSLPAMAAPIGGVSFNMSKMISEEDYIKAVIDGAAEAGAIACTGDGEMDLIHQAGCRAIAACGGRGIPFIKPWKSEEIIKKAELAKESGSGIFGIDIDASGLITLKLMGKPVFPKNRQELRSIIEQSGMKVILKGIMSAEEALRAEEAGASAIVVSNHGGRVLDACPGTAEVLPEISDALGGRITVLVDGGVRTGIDLFKMIALGADAVLIGRPVAISALGGGARAVSDYFTTLQQEFYRTMMMTGCQTVDDVKREKLYQSRFQRQ